jgi:hypothetical protein
VIALAAAALAGSLLVPHLVRQDRIAAPTGIALWLCVLCLRAALAVAGAILLLFYFPATQLFQVLTHWCVHAVIPLVTTHLGFSGHRLGDAAVVVPAIVVGVSLVSAAVASWRAARAVRRWLRRSGVGRGPDESVVVDGDEIVLAAAGLRAPRVVVSAGALCALDDPELRAGLEHERGHIARRHRFVFLLGGLLHSLARLIPGSRAALGQLHFHLERDADEYAVRRTGDPLALASAICKAASAPMSGTAVVSSLGGGSVAKRVDILLGANGSSPGARALAYALAGLAASLTLVLIGAAPALAAIGVEQLQSGGGEHLCRS